jgi:hypothetical protein
MAGYWQEKATFSGNGTTAYRVYNCSVIVPFRAVYLSQVTCRASSGGTGEKIFVYQTSGNGSSNATTSGASPDLIYSNSTFTSDFLNVRNLWRFGTTTGDSATNAMKLHVSVVAANTSGTASLNGTVWLGGFGLN